MSRSHTLRHFRRLCTTSTGTASPIASSRRILHNSDHVSDTETLFESHRNDPRITREPYISSLIRSYGRAGMLDLALRTYHQMDDLGTPRSAISFNALLSAYCKSRMFDQVSILFREIPQKYGISPDKFSYGILVKAYCKKSSMEEALGVLSEMEKKGIEVNVVTFTTIFNALHRNGMREQAELLWDKVVSDGCVLDVAAYNTRIMYDHSGEAENVKALIDEMRNVGLKPDITSYNFLIACYCVSGMMEEAVEVYEGLRKNGCQPNAGTFRTLIYYLSWKGDCVKGFEICKESVKVHSILDFDTVMGLAEVLVEKEKIEVAKELNEIVKKNAPPDFLNKWKNVEDEIGLLSAAHDEC